VRWLVRGLLFLALGASLAAQWPEAWRHWRYSAPIDVAAISPGQLASVTLPAAVTLLARPEWLDLRVIDSGGGEVPFVLHANIGGRTFDRRPLPLLEPSAVDGQYQQAIVDTGESGGTHNSVKLGLNTDRDLLSWVEIAVSSDLADWRIVRERAPIYVLRAEGRGENTDVTYPESASRYVRIRILDGSGTYALYSAELGRETSTVAERVPAGVTLTASTGAPGHSVWTSSGDASALPLSRVEFESSRTSFVRPVTIERGDARGRWREVARGDVLRQTGGVGEERAWLTIDFPETRAARWRITVDHRNDTPVADLAPRLMTTPRRVVFQPEAGESYRLLVGHPRAAAPGYDLGRLTEADALDAAQPAPLGAVVENAGWVDPAPWTERYDAVLWAALIVAVLVLGAVAVRTLRGHV
jgi:hypothetical protein